MRAAGEENLVFEVKSRRFGRIWGVETAKTGVETGCVEHLLREVFIQVNTS